jgi:hypothetical protein
MKGGNCQRYTYISGLKPEKNRRRLRKNRPALLLPYTDTNSPAAPPQLTCSPIYSRSFWSWEGSLRAPKSREGCPVTTSKLSNQVSLAYLCETSLNPCLMHRCVCIWRYILQNYKYKLYFQNLSIYHIPHVCIGDPGCWKSWCLHCLWHVR